MADPASAKDAGLEFIPGRGGLPPPEVLAALPHDNAAARLNIAIWILNAASLVFVGLRVYCKSFRSRKLWWDDWILVLSWVVLVSSSSVVSYTTTLGYGRHTWDFPIDNLSKFSLAVTVAGTLTLTAAVWSKTSFAFTIWRLSEGGTRRLVVGLMLSMNIAMGISALLTWVQCTPLAKAWDPMMPGRCWDPHTIVYYNIFSGAFSAAMDITLSLLPWKILWGLQMRKMEKVGVIVAMSMGLAAGATAIVKCTKLTTMLSTDMYDNVDLFIWGNAESAVTIMAASVPHLRALFRELRSSAKGTDPAALQDFKFSANFYARESKPDEESRSPPTRRSSEHVS